MDMPHSHTNLHTPEHPSARSSSSSVHREAYPFSYHPTTSSIASSMLAMRSSPPEMLHVPPNGPAPKSDRKMKREEAPVSPPAAKRSKVSRERQLKINAASRRCRKKQKLELQFLRTHVVELQQAIQDEVDALKTSLNPQQRIAQLETLLHNSQQKVEEMSSGMRPPKKATSPRESSDDETSSNGEFKLSEQRQQHLLKIADFVRVNMSMESQSFSPEVISCLPIEMDGWQLRLAITAKNYTIHNTKFFPCRVQDLYNFCWETNVRQKQSVLSNTEAHCIVTPLREDVAHVVSKTIGKWSLEVHGVAHVSYNSVVCRSYLPSDPTTAIICQQSVLDEQDLHDENTIPWLFKRWVVFRPTTVDGIEGTHVEAYRTASYATGKLIYKDENAYDSFCEHLIRRYAESNALLEKEMAKDSRFQHIAHDLPDANEAHDESVSAHMVKDLLLF